MRTLGSLLAFGLLATAAGGLTLLAWRALRPAPAGPPVLDCPAEVDLGPQEFGNSAVGRFRVTNRGGADLLLSRFGTSCSCAGVEIEQDGAPRRVEELRLPPGGHADLSVRIAVGVQPGMPQNVSIGFATNVPDRPEAGVRVVIPRVTGGLVATPTAVVFGDVPLGRPPTVTVQLHSNGTVGRRVRAARSLRPDRFEVRLISSDAPDSTAPDPSRPVAVLEVTARADRPGRLDGAIEVELVGEARATDRIPVLGEVVPQLVARPPALVLPRYANGKPTYAARVELTGREGTGLGVAVDSVPPGVTAVVGPVPGAPDRWAVEVTADPARAPKAGVVRLRATGAGDPVVLDVPVTTVPVNP